MVDDKNFELNLKLAFAIAKKNRGVCLSKQGLPKSKKYLWKCEDGHSWSASLSNIAGNKSKIGTWCPYCSGVRNKNSWIDRLKEKAKKNKGQCLDQECKNQNSKVRFKCSQKHIWLARASHVINGSWCPECAGNVTHNIEVYKKIAKEKEGECLSKEYANQRSVLRFRCKQNHEWAATAGNIFRGSWCPHCSKNVALDLSILEDVARKRGGHCLSDSYVNANTKYLWECSEKHTWKAAYSGISTGSWCPVCSEFIGERIVRLYFESVFEMKFEKQHPEWLRKKKGDPWEIDGVSESEFGGYKIGFEHNGIQHYQLSPMFHKKKAEFLAQKEKDILRRRRCFSNKVILVEVPQMFKMTSLDELPKLVQKQLHKYKHLFVSYDFEKKIDYSVVYKNYKMDDLRKIAMAKEGNFLGYKILKNKQFATMRCNQGHEWDVIPSSLKNGTWCPFCAGKKMSGGWFEHYCKIAEEKGGSCLSTEADYVDARSNLKWKCKEGHTWKASPSSIKGRTWCPVCGIKKRSESQKDTISKMLEIAKKNGGNCLSQSYVNNHSKLDWECSKGHTWKATPGSIKSGSWCPKCYLVQKKNKNK